MKDRAIHDFKLVQTSVGRCSIAINNTEVIGISGVDISVKPRDFLRVTLEGIDTGTTIVDGEAVLYVKLGDDKYRIMEYISDEL